MKYWKGPYLAQPLKLIAYDLREDNLTSLISAHTGN